MKWKESRDNYRKNSMNEVGRSQITLQSSVLVVFFLVHVALDL